MQEIPPTQPESPQNPSPKKRYIIILLVILILAGIAYLLTSTNLFKGALYVDESLREKKEKSEIAFIEKEIEEAEKFRDEEGASHTLDCDVVIAGAGTGGYSAAIASAREGAKTCLIEESDWLGGMLTSAGVAAIDGRPDSASGIFHEIIQKIETHYANQGKSDQIHNCSVSYLCFEPHVGDFILKEMAAKEENLEIYLNAEVDKVYRSGNKILGINFIQDGINYIVNADITIDATEYGDLMFLGDVDHDLGVDQNSQESLAQQADQCIQPLTYVAILKKQSTPSIIPQPPNYDKNKYKCIIKGPLCPDSSSLFDKDRLLSYGRMPDDKLMINIPSHSFGNDFHATSDNLETYSRQAILEEAKNYSRGFIYFIQTELGMQNYALYNEFQTDDSFAKIPYVRESRRLKGLSRLIENDIVKAGGGQRADLVDDSIAIGDYPIDLHFCKYGVGDIFKPIAPYQIPYSTTIPQEVDGFMVADKNISVSHIVNGTTRLQPVTMAVGQAVGTAAAMASKQGIQPRNVNIEQLQNKLIDLGSNLFFFKDLPAQHWAYKNVAALAINGWISGYADFTFKPNNPVNESDFLKIIRVVLISKGQEITFLDQLDLKEGSQKSVTRGDVIHHLYKLMELTAKLPLSYDKSISFQDLSPDSDLHQKVQILASMGIVNTKNSNYRPHDHLTRAEAVVFMTRAVEILYPSN